MQLLAEGGKKNLQRNIVNFFYFCDFWLEFYTFLFPRFPQKYDFVFGVSVNFSVLDIYSYIFAHKTFNFFHFKYIMTIKVFFLWHIYMQS